MKYLLLLCFVTSVFGGYLESLAASASASASAPAKDQFKGMVAFRCGLPALHRNSAGQWVRDLYQDCVNTEEEVRRYCRRVYPDTVIVSVEQFPADLRVASWCPFDKEKCPDAKVVTVRPYRCLDQNFLSDPLLVPTGCSFGHMVPGMSSQEELKAGTCKSQAEWNAAAAAECAKRFNGFKLRRAGGLVSCQKDKAHQVGFFKGVEFVCCPPNQATQQPPLVSVSAQTFDPNAVAVPKPQQPVPKPQQPVPKPQRTAEKPKKVGAPRDLYVDYLNRAQDPDESEHDRYMDAKDALRRHNRAREDKLVKSYIEAEHSLDDTWKVDKAGADMLEKNVIRKFRRVFAAMLDQEMNELRQLDHIHQRRVLEKLHAKSERARKMLEYASQEGDPKLKRVSEAAFSYLRAVMKEKVHAINHYSHLLDTDPTEAGRQLSQLRSYLHELHEEMKKELNRIAQKAPPLSEKLTERILQFMRTYSEVEAAAKSLEETGKLSAQASKGESHKDLEIEHMESVIKAYEHGHHGQKAAASSKQPPKQPPKQQSEEEKVVHVLPVPGDEDDNLLTDHIVREEKKPHGFAHVKPNFASNDVNDHDHDHDHDDHDGHDHEHDRGERRRAGAASGAATWAVIGCVAAAALIAAVSALLVLRRRYAGYSPAPANGACVATASATAAATAADVLPTKLAPPLGATDLAAMQTNGYENPTYKYFELRGKSEDVSEA